MMFTGLIEGLGTVTQLTPEVAGLRITIAPPPEMVSSTDPVRLGDSIAINGCCLTVIDLVSSPRPRSGGEGQGEGANAPNDSHPAQSWAFQAGEETLSKTNLGQLQTGDAVNLERSLPALGRLGGHFVLGHVDGVGTVDAIDKTGDWLTMWFRVPASLADLMISKGSVAVDGVSLTLVTVEPTRFSVALIPHTLSVTTLGRRNVGDAVNLETDVLGKYVRKFVVIS